MWYHYFYLNRRSEYLFHHYQWHCSFFKKKTSSLFQKGPVRPLNGTLNNDCYMCYTIQLKSFMCSGEIWYLTTYHLKLDEMFRKCIENESHVVFHCPFLWGATQNLVWWHTNKYCLCSYRWCIKMKLAFSHSPGENMGIEERCSLSR